jgi:hypothetical protein
MTAVTFPEIDEQGRGLDRTVGFSDVNAGKCWWILLVGQSWVSRRFGATEGRPTRRARGR